MDSLRSRLLCAAFFAMFLLWSAGVLAQAVPEYVVRNIRPDSNAAPNTAAVMFEIENVGSSASAIGSVRLVVVATGGEIASQPIPPLNAGEIRTFRFEIPVDAYQPGQRVSFGVLIDLPGGAPPTGGGQFDGQIGIVIPAVGTPAPIDAAQPARPTIFGISITNPLVVVGLIGGLGALLIFIWFASMIARMFLIPPPTFGAWQPPYATNPMIDPNSIAGRRQLWQQHAQSDALTLPCNPNSYMVRKLPTGIDGRKLSSWRVTGIRLSQYDMYGRVDRSQTIIKPSLVKRFDRLMQKCTENPIPAQQIERLARPIADRLIRALFAKAGRRNLGLPIALDIRLSGAADEVEVLFELHRCIGQGWELIDRWQTDLYATDSRVLENFTYTLFGQQKNEPYKAFRQRLRDDLVRLLTGMLFQPPLQEEKIDFDTLEPVDFAALAETISIEPAASSRSLSETAPAPSLPAQDTSPRPPSTDR
jgi:hypothetical protein